MSAAAPHHQELNLIGQRIGHYQLTREIGRGGMGAVFEGLHESIGQRIAVKVLFPEFSENTRHVKRFFDEARAVNIVKHAGLVKVYDYGQLPDGTAYISMEHLQGESLQGRIDRLRKAKQRMPVAEALRLCRQMASALEAVHASGIAHRDLKPGNIFIVDDPEAPGGERVKIVDFGIAKFFAVPERGEGRMLTTTGRLLGTPAYMSPEQCGGAHQVDDRTDVYALGIIMYQLLAGKLPFEAEVSVIMMTMHITERERPLGELCEEAPPEAHALVHEMLVKDPATRLPMSQVVQRLEEILAGKVRARRWRLRGRTRRALAIGGMAAAGLVGLGLAGWLLLARPGGSGQAASGAGGQQVGAAGKGGQAGSAGAVAGTQPAGDGAGAGGQPSTGPAPVADQSTRPVTPSPAQAAATSKRGRSGKGSKGKGPREAPEPTTQPAAPAQETPAPAAAVPVWR